MNSQLPDNNPLPPPPTLPQSTPEELPPVLIPSLPYDVALNILCRIPRYHHPKLSTVSKSFRSLLSSPLFFNTRRHVNSIQPCLYLSLRLPTTSTSTSPAAASIHYYTLHQNPISRKRFLTQVSPPLPGFRSLIGSAFVNVGPKIYIIGGSINDVPSSHVWTLDCRFHTWEQATNMRVGREFAAAGVLEEKIYVIGGCVADNWARSKFWAEVFDAKTGVWECVPSPFDVKEKWMHASAVIDGKVYAMADRGGVKYEPKSDTWDSVEKRLDLGWRGRACVIDGVLYCYDYLGKIRGFDVKQNMWKELSGVDRGLPKFLCGATMANCGGKLVVAWEGKSGGGGGSSKEVEIWCAEIEVEKSQDGKLLGKIEWVDMVLSVPNGSCIVHCLAVTL